MRKNFKQIKIEMTEGNNGATPNASLLFTAKFFEQSGLSKIINASMGSAVRESEPADLSPGVFEMRMIYLSTWL